MRYMSRRRGTALAKTRARMTLHFKKDRAVPPARDPAASGRRQPAVRHPEAGVRTGRPHRGGSTKSPAESPAEGQAQVPAQVQVRGQVRGATSGPWRGRHG